MKRDMDLIRRLLIQIEEGDNGDGEDLHIDFGDTPERIANAHLRLLSEGGLIETFATPDTDDDDLTHYVPQRLTWQGHDFLASIRDQEIWRQTKEAAKKGGTEAIGAVWDIAKAIGKAEVKRRTGLDF